MKHKIITKVNLMSGDTLTSTSEVVDKEIKDDTKYTKQLRNKYLKEINAKGKWVTESANGMIRKEDISAVMIFVEKIYEPKVRISLWTKIKRWWKK